MANLLIDMVPTKGSSQESEMPDPVGVPYLLVVEQRLPLYRDANGQLFAEELWHKDLEMHLQYIDHLMLASPCAKQEPPSNAKRLSSGASRLELIELPQQDGLLSSLRVMPAILTRLYKAVRAAGVVHSGIVGWPIPMGWIVAPLSLVFRKPLVIVVESATWRLQPGVRAGWKKRLRAAVQEAMAHWVLRKAALVICTQEEYRQSLLGRNRAHSFVIPASWIDANDILTNEEAEEHWNKKLSRLEPRLRILFVGRLVQDKGVLTLLEAMRQLSQESMAISLDILGEGDLKPLCVTLAAELCGPATARLIGTVRYGQPLFEVIRGYDAVVVPSIGDEQPRIVFDAYSQAIPVLASDTPGLRSCLQSGHSHLMASAGDAAAWADLFRYAAANRFELKRLGVEALVQARNMTHQHMHRQRAKLLRQMLDGRLRATSHNSSSPSH